MQVGVSIWYPDPPAGGTVFNFVGGMPGGFTTVRASAANYWNSAGVRTAVAANEPRNDYDPQTLQARGVLLEEQRTNFLLNSLAPVTQSVSLSTGTYVCWMEGSGTVTTSAGTATGSGFGVASNATGLGTFGTINTFIVTGAGTVTFTVSGTVTAFQCELGAYATSMITTAGASATRAIDLVTRSTSGIYNETEGGVVVEAMLSNVAGFSMSNQVVHIDNGTTNNAVNHAVFGSAHGWVSRVGGTAQCNIGFSPRPAENVVFKVAGRYKANDFQAAKNGTLGSADTSGSVPTGITTMRLGSRVNDQSLNGWLRRVEVYTTALTDAQLQSLTA